MFRISHGSLAAHFTTSFGNLRVELIFPPLWESFNKAIKDVKMAAKKNNWSVFHNYFCVFANLKWHLIYEWNARSGKTDSAKVVCNHFRSRDCSLPETFLKTYKLRTSHYEMLDMGNCIRIQRDDFLSVWLRDLKWV